MSAASHQVALSSRCLALRSACSSASVALTLLATVEDARRQNEHLRHLQNEQCERAYVALQKSSQSSYVVSLRFLLVSGEHGTREAIGSHTYRYAVPSTAPGRASGTCGSVQREECRGTARLSRAVVPLASTHGRHGSMNGVIPTAPTITSSTATQTATLLSRCAPTSHCPVARTQSGTSVAAARRRSACRAGSHRTVQGCHCGTRTNESARALRRSCDRRDTCMN